MSTLFYIIGILTCCFVCFGMYKIIKLIEGKLPLLGIPNKSSNVNNVGDIGRDIGRGVIEALEEQREKELREEDIRKYAEASMRGPTPVISSTLDVDRKVRLNRDDMLIPQNLSEEDKRILEEFYGR
jgi:hypothetical protein